MKALTLWRPWPVAMFFLRYELQKDVENRSWKPPEWIIGKRIAIHAGARYVDVFDEWLHIIKPNPTEILQLLSEWKRLSEIRGIIGTCVVTGWSETAISKWAEDGMVHWHMDSRRSLRKPIPCKGAQGLWNVPPEIEKRILEL